MSTTTTLTPTETYTDQALLDGALAKVAATDVASVKKIAIAFSGGLDSTLCIVLAKEKYDAEVVLITVDVGQGDDEIAMAFEKAAPLLVSLRPTFMQRSYNCRTTTSPLSSRMTRAV